jgi:sortase A
MRATRAAGALLTALGATLLAVAATHVATGLRAQSDAKTGRPVRRAPETPSAPRVLGEPVGRLEIPRIGLDAAVFEGVSAATLRKGPGHLPETAWPLAAGDVGGNCVIAGHRDSFFRALREAKEGDLVLLTDAAGVRRYRLGARSIVRPDDLSVVAPTDEARLTLITCYPFRWIGAAPLRLAWSAVEAREQDGAAAR